MTPHFALPFRIDNDGRVPVHEQDSEDEIMDCVEAIVRYNIGHRPEKPDFGIPEEVFASPEPDVVAIQAALSQWEPRIEMSVENTIDVIDPLVHKIRVERSA